MASTEWPNLDPSLLRIGFDVVQRLHTGQQAPSQHEVQRQSHGNQSLSSYQPEVASASNVQPSALSQDMPSFISTPEFHNLVTALTQANNTTVDAQNSHPDHHLPVVIDAPRAVVNRVETQPEAPEAPKAGAMNNSDRTRSINEAVDEGRLLPISTSFPMSQGHASNHTPSSSSLPSPHSRDRIAASSLAPMTRIGGQASLERWRGVISPLLLQNAQLRRKDTRVNRVPRKGPDSSIRTDISDDLCQELVGKMCQAKIQLEARAKQEKSSHIGDNAERGASRDATPLPTTSRSTSVSASNDNIPRSLRTTPSTFDAPTAPRAMHNAWKNSIRSTSTPRASSTVSSGKRSVSYDTDRLPHTPSRPQDRQISRPDKPFEFNPAKRKRSHQSDTDDDDRGLHLKSPFSSNRAHRSTSCASQPMSRSTVTENAYRGSRQSRSRSRTDESHQRDYHAFPTAHTPINTLNGVPSMNGHVDILPGAVRDASPISTVPVSCSASSDEKELLADVMEVDQGPLTSGMPEQQSAVDHLASHSEPTLPCHTVPGLWFVQPALDSPGMLDCQFEIDVKTAEKWHIHQNLDLSTEMLSLHLLCISIEAAQDMFKNMMASTPETLCAAVWNSFKEWPLQGTLLVQINPNESDGKTWLPQDLVSQIKAKTLFQVLKLQISRRTVYLSTSLTWFGLVKT
ncbi:hypothetical protein VNI00_013256 [Paramarasmius palmivorus]|uniref:Uncharacterized protein n=1 Tax=Paramarasmius palmivorus TaxID=297713 RepID=A0AAW0C169_9AGAR